MKKKILIIADIEGSSGCLTRAAAKFLGSGWPRACLAMSRDVKALASALLQAGAGQVRIQDFHRTGYNLFQALMPAGAELVQGYRRGPVPGMGTPGPFDLIMMIGMHAPSGTDGFLAHTLTSRIASVSVNGHLISEAQLFASALVPAAPVFFSGCPVACCHTQLALPGISCFPLDKTEPGFDPGSWRQRMAEAGVQAMADNGPGPYNPSGPFRARIRLTAGNKSARHMAGRWGLPCKGGEILLDVPDMRTLFQKLSQIIFLTPVTQRLVPVGLPLYHAMGRAGLTWAQVHPEIRDRRP